jgi:hypothetical protein
MIEYSHMMKVESVDPIPEQEKVDLQESPVTQQEMQEAVAALNFVETPPIGDVVEEKETLHMEENMDRHEVSNVLKDQEKIHALQTELENIPPHVDVPVEGQPDPDNEPKPLNWMTMEHKKCEKCQGSGRRWLIFPCFACKGNGQIFKTLVRPNGERVNMSNEKVIEE